MEPEYWKRAIIKLKKEDVILKSVIERNQKNILKSRKDPFGTLLKSIVGQQISVKAAESIYKKLLKLLQADVSPNMLLSIDKQALRETGLSRQKINYLFNISKYFIENPNTSTKEYFLDANEETIKSNLIAIKGVGPWTIEMFLIFFKMSPDILPLGDIGLINAIKKVYNLDRFEKTNQIDKINQISNKWRPYRTVATWYLWQVIDDELVEY
ncbi:MAG: DNA-3-methyladenine glycosylase 2 family protein [Pseudomonadota bacterium]|nr:DNA-3-methyladenine glycosylase 2 family protein [Pseudomonadota bacterium]MEC8452866.1 DNA-3-methyladenine glycosylase 2 family protein [Pseudomonadota bacterium]